MYNYEIKSYQIKCFLMFKKYWKYSAKSACFKYYKNSATSETLVSIEKWGGKNVTLQWIDRGKISWQSRQIIKFYSQIY